MGGNIWKGRSVRLCREDYLDLVREMLNFRRSIPMVQVIPSYFSKESFGDMDLVYTGCNKDHLIAVINNNFDVIDYNSNGPVTSFLIAVNTVSCKSSAESAQLFQVDFIYCPPEELEFSYNYFSWNDCGNFIGRLAHRIGLSFGHDGLWYMQRDGDYLVKRHLLTRDFATALRYLDLNEFAHLYDGFETPEDIYKFIVKSKYFDFASVELSQRNAVSRTRDKKRVMYKNFIKWLEENNLNVYNDKLSKDKNSFLNQHFKKFPKFKEDYIQCYINLISSKTIKEKFNGNIVMNLTGLCGKDLGGFMTLCKSKYWYEDIINLTQHDINAHILLTYGEYKENGQSAS